MNNIFNKIGKFFKLLDSWMMSGRDPVLGLTTEHLLARDRLIMKAHRERNEKSKCKCDKDSEKSTRDTD